MAAGGLQERQVKVNEVAKYNMCLLALLPMLDVEFQHVIQLFYIIFLLIHLIHHLNL
jgi:hypothetical protein